METEPKKSRFVCRVTFLNPWLLLLGTWTAASRRGQLLEPIPLHPDLFSTDTMSLSRKHYTKMPTSHAVPATSLYSIMPHCTDVEIRVGMPLSSLSILFAEMRVPEPRCKALCQGHQCELRLVRHRHLKELWRRAAPTTKVLLLPW